MNLFKKKCEYCRTKIEKGNEVRRGVKILGYSGIHPRNFCNEEHAQKYEQELNEHIKQEGKSGGKCC